MNATIPDLDLHLHAEGTHRRLHEQLGAQPGAGGCRFAVWAPSARAVHVVCDVDWDTEFELHPNGSSGIWSGWVDDAGVGTTYRFRVTGQDGSRFDKSDPLGAAHHGAPSTDSYIPDLHHEWGDDEWMATRAER
ncbi:MAG: GlgB N-terminal domain-containing protein, partial [Acidimicrobiia bacterium]